MVLYYGLLALETANNTIAATSAAMPATTTTTGIVSDRASLSRKQKYSSNSIGKMASTSLSSSSSNSWIYTEDLRKRFEERYADCRYVLVPVYIDRKSAKHSHSTTAILPQTNDRENSWMYSRPLRDHLYYSASKISLPLTAHISSSACCVTNHGFMRDELPSKKSFKARLFKRSSSTKEKSTIDSSLSSLPFSPLTSSTSSFSTTNNLVKHRTSDVVEEEDDEGVDDDDENHSIPLIKQDSTLASSLPSSRTMTTSPTDNNALVNPTTTSESATSNSTSSNTKSLMKHATSHSNRLTRLRSFLFKSSPSSSALSRPQQQQQQQQEQ